MAGRGWAGRIPGIGKAKSLIAGDAFVGRLEELLARSTALRNEVESLRLRVTEAEVKSERWQRLEAHIPDLLASTSEATGALRRLRRDATTLERQAEAALEQQQVAERLGDSIQELWTHVRTVRAEILHEIRLRGPMDTEIEAIEAKIVDQARLDELTAAGPLKVNLGCGHIALPGYVNVDMRELPGVDVVARLDDLPFEPASLGLVHSAHVVEHFPPEILKHSLLPYWRSLLAPDGEFSVVVPDGEAMARGLAAGSIPFEDYAAVLMGEQEYEGDAHHSVFSPESLADILGAVGFVDVEVVATSRPLDICLEMELKARRGDL